MEKITLRILKYKDNLLEFKISLIEISISGSPAQIWTGDPYIISVVL